jgi:hypothetical protein
MEPHEQDVVELCLRHVLRTADSVNAGIDILVHLNHLNDLVQLDDDIPAWKMLLINAAWASLLSRAQYALARAHDEAALAASQLCHVYTQMFDQQEDNFTELVDVFDLICNTDGTKGIDVLRKLEVLAALMDRTFVRDPTVASPQCRMVIVQERQRLMAAMTSALASMLATVADDDQYERRLEDSARYPQACELIGRLCDALARHLNE